MSERYFTVPFEMGQVVVHNDGEGKVRSIGFDLDARFEAKPYTNRFGRDIERYFEGDEVLWDIELDLGGLSEFQLAVYRTVANIPYGSTLSYSEVAGKAGYPRGARAVGQVMSANRFPLIVPCHRVISKNMGIGGFSSGLGLKRYLLRLEGVDL